MQDEVGEAVLQPTSFSYLKIPRVSHHLASRRSQQRCMQYHSPCRFLSKLRMLGKSYPAGLSRTFLCDLIARYADEARFQR